MALLRSSWFFAALAFATLVASADGPDPQALADRIDSHLDARLVEAGVSAAPPADDAEFLRRVSLDVAGRIPSPHDVYAFLNYASADKRSRLVDDLLASSRAELHAARLWQATLAPEIDANPEARIFREGFEAWLQERLRRDTPYDVWVRELLTTPISADAERPTPALLRPEAPNPLAFYAVKEAKPENLAAAATRIFLGVQIECAQCHDHPFDRWSQEQFWNQAAFFSGRKREGDGLFAPLSESFDVRTARIEGTEQYVSAAFLDESEPGDARLREAFAGWIASDDNPYFAKAAANRVWSRYFGRGLVEPIDDFRDDNPASHPELLDELARALVDADFDLDYLARAIGRTKAYQRTSSETDSRQSDPTLFARMAPRGLTGEQFFDSLVLATGYDEARARRSPRAEFVARFGSTVRASAPETSIPQALALRNGSFMAQVTSLENGRTLAAACETPGLSIDERIELLYVSALSRRPTHEELSRAKAFIAAAPAVTSDEDASKDAPAPLAEPLGDLFWTLLVSAEFRLNH